MFLHICIFSYPIVFTDLSENMRDPSYGCTPETGTCRRFGRTTSAAPSVRIRPGQIRTARLLVGSDGSVNGTVVRGASSTKMYIAAVLYCRDVDVLSLQGSAAPRRVRRRGACRLSFLFPVDCEKSNLC